VEPPPARRCSSCRRRVHPPDVAEIATYARSTKPRRGQR
jgi:hypothetical protein